MVTGLIQGLLPSIFVTLAVASNTPSATLQTTNSAVVRESRIYVVQNEDTFESIAEFIYGDRAYWTTLWNDNAWVENPNSIEPGMQLSLRNETPQTVDSLQGELVKRYDELSVSFAQLTPTVVDTQDVQATLPVVTATPIPQQQPVVHVSGGTGPLSSEHITFLGMCESGMTATRNSGNGYYGAFQFSIGTWNSMGTGYERADMAPLDVQIDAVQRLLSRSSIWTQFPGCAAKMRNAGLI